MADRCSVHLDDAEQASCDCLNLFHVLDVILTADIGPLNGVTRDALATVSRIGRQRASNALENVQEAQGGDRG